MKAPIPEVFQGLPVVSPARMAELDRAATERYGIPSLDLMENAGRGIAEEARSMLEAKGQRIQDSLLTVCCGRGNNGGDGLVAARYLKEMGAEVMAFIAPAKRGGTYSPEVQKNLGRAASAGVSAHQVSEELVELDVRLRSSALLIDALLGTGSSGKPAGAIHKMIQCMMKARKPILAVDIPSGLDPSTGYHSGVVVTADVSCALGLPKTGLLAAAAKRFVGELKVLDIGFPKDLIDSLRRP